MSVVWAVIVAAVMSVLQCHGQVHVDPRCTEAPLVRGCPGL
jgi:hypothetical protein